MTAADAREPEEEEPIAIGIRAALDGIWSNITFDGIAESTAEAVVVLAHRPAAKVLLERPDARGNVVATVGVWDTGRRWMPRVFGDAGTRTDSPLCDKAGLALGALSTRPPDDGPARPDDAIVAGLLANQAGLAAGYVRLQERAERFEQELTAARAELHVLRGAWQVGLDEAPHGMSVVSLRRSDFGEQLQVNDALGRIAEREADELVGTPLLDLLATDGRGGVADALRRAAGGRRSPAERQARVKTASGELRLVRVTVTPVLDAEHKPKLAVCHVQQVGHEPPPAGRGPRVNAADFAELITRAVKDAQRYEATTALMLCDLSDLDRLLAGAEPGSKQRLVDDLVARLRTMLRSDDAVGQLDEHALSLLLADTGAEDAVHVAQRVRATLDEVVREHGHDIDPHVGVTMIDSRSEPASSLRDATSAMRAARASTSHVSLFPSASPDASAASRPTYIIRNRRRRRGGLVSGPVP